MARRFFLDGQGNGAVELRAFFGKLRLLEVQELPLLAKKILVILVIVCITAPLAAYVIAGYFHVQKCSHDMLCLKAWSTGELLRQYMEDNHGRFPENELSLVQGGFLRVDTSDGKRSRRRYYARFKSHGSSPDWAITTVGEWVHLESFASYTIRYGTDPNALELREGKLYATASGQQVLLLDGPMRRRWPHIYESVSKDLFQAMMKSRSSASKDDHD